MRVDTTEPCRHFYSRSFLQGNLTGKNGAGYERRGGLYLETQHSPESATQPSFPLPMLSLAETYRSRTIDSFRTQSAPVGP